MYIVLLVLYFSFPVMLRLMTYFQKTRRNQKVRRRKPRGVLMKISLETQMIYLGIFQLLNLKLLKERKRRNKLQKLAVQNQRKKKVKEEEKEMNHLQKVLYVCSAV